MQTRHELLFYASENGDRWLLDCEDDVLSVMHYANEPSGGRVTTYDLGAFLVQERHSAENRSLRQLIGTLLNPLAAIDPARTDKDKDTSTVISPKPDGDDKEHSDLPELKDVEPGSDADATPVPKVGETPPNPNQNDSDADVRE
ncbi:hypothetical protein [Devosia sp. 1635]|uniref:hypothetical protein n=1 Tax=Devosia sp. 1635 TaxID=2726066 RepID=UPI0015638D7A|nr:hypothetical protein [Devosia sp. 1635]